MMNAGPDPDGFMDFFARELAEPLRKLTPRSLLFDAERTPVTPPGKLPPGRPSIFRGVVRRRSVSTVRSVGDSGMSLPEVASPQEWLEARRRLLAREKEFTRARDALSADRRRLPMVKVDQEYVFEGPSGPVTLAGLFGDRRQLIDHLVTRETVFVLASRAPQAKIATVAKERDWFVPWYSTYGSDFNYDYQVTLDADRGLLQHNYREEPDAAGGERSTELPGVSCFLRAGGRSSTPIRLSPAHRDPRQRLQLPRPDRPGPPGRLGRAQGPGPPRSAAATRRSAADPERSPLRPGPRIQYPGEFRICPHWFLKIPLRGIVDTCVGY